MKKVFLFLLATSAATMVLTLASCGNSSAWKQESDSTSCVFSNLRGNRFARGIDEYNDTNCYDNTVRILWPQVINGEPCPDLQQALIKTLIDSAGITQIEQVIPCLLAFNIPDASGKERVTELKGWDNDCDNHTTSDVNVRLQSMSDRLLTYQIFCEEYHSHAAHGLYASHYVTYDLKNKAVITLSDVVADTTTLRAAILKSIKETLDIDKDRLILPDNGLLPLPMDFYFEDNTLHVVYQLYAIMSYADGIVDVPIYPYALKDEQIKRLFTPLGLEIIDFVE